MRTLHRQGPRQARAARGRNPDAGLVRLQRDGVSRAGSRRCARLASSSGLASRWLSSRAGAARRLALSLPPVESEVPAALISAFSYDDRVLLERYIEGRELAVSVLGGQPLPIVEAIPAGGDRYDFEARYGIGRTELHLPGAIPGESAAVTDRGAWRLRGAWRQRLRPGRPDPCRSGGRRYSRSTRFPDSPTPASCRRLPRLPVFHLRIWSRGSLTWP